MFLMKLCSVMILAFVLVLSRSEAAVIQSRVGDQAMQVRVTETKDQTIHFDVCSQDQKKKVLCTPIGDQKGYSREAIRERILALQQEKQRQAQLNNAIIVVTALAGGYIGFKLPVRATGWINLPLLGHLKNAFTGTLLGSFTGTGIAVVKSVIYDSQIQFAGDGLAKIEGLTGQDTVLVIDSDMREFVKALNFALMLPVATGGAAHPSLP